MYDIMCPSLAQYYALLKATMRAGCGGAHGAGGGAARLRPFPLRFLRQVLRAA